MSYLSVVVVAVAVAVVLGRFNVLTRVCKQVMTLLISIYNLVEVCRCHLVTFHIRHSHAKCIVTTSICESVCLCFATFLFYCTDLDVTLGNSMGCPLVVHYLVDLQLVHRFRCYGNICT